MRGKLSKKLKSSILIATLIISLESVCVIPGNAAESTSKSENGYVVDEYERLATSLSNKTVGAVSFYDPRNSNIMTDIKDQETTDLCWLYGGYICLQKVWKQVFHICGTWRCGYVQCYFSKKYWIL